MNLSRLVLLSACFAASAVEVKPSNAVDLFGSADEPLDWTPAADAAAGKAAVMPRRLSFDPKTITLKDVRNPSEVETILSSLFNSSGRLHYSTEVDGKHGQDLGSSLTLSAPKWWSQPTECNTEALACALQGRGFGNGAEKNLGDHICALDTCHPTAFDSTWSNLQSQWDNVLSLFNRIPRDTIIFAIGDSTMKQQIRALNCIIEEAAGSAGLYFERATKDSIKGTIDIDAALANFLEQIDCDLHVNLVTYQRLLICSKWSAKGLYTDGEVAVKDMILQSSIARGTNVDRFHLAVIVGQGAWVNCEGGCADWHFNLHKFEKWWRDAQRDNSIPNATLIIRDALPQHFPTDDGRFIRGKMLQQCGAITDRETSGKQAIKVRSDEDCSSGKTIIQDDPQIGLRRLPIWGLAMRQAHLHSMRPVLDCTHYCLPATTLWNVMMAHIIVEQISGLDEANKHGGWFASLLNSRSTEETQLDLLAANADACS